MNILSNKFFQIIVIPIIVISITQVFALLAKEQSKLKLDDFVRLPYSLGSSAVAINFAFGISNPSKIVPFYGWTLIIILFLGLIAFFQRYLNAYPRLVCFLGSAFGFALLSFTYLICGKKNVIFDVVSRNRYGINLPWKHSCGFLVALS